MDAVLLRFTFRGLPSHQNFADFVAHSLLHMVVHMTWLRGSSMASSDI